MPSPEHALKLLMLATERTAGGVTSFELMLREGIDTVVRFGPGMRNPLAGDHRWYVLIELSSQARSGLREVMENILAEGMEQGLVEDATIADSLDQAKNFWRIREQFGELIRHLGGSIKHDVSVPVASVPAFIKEANAAVIKLIPGSRPMPFGHLGDGNIHYNITQPEGADKAAFHGALGRGQRGGVRSRAQIRRLDLGRARRRHRQARMAAEGEGPGGV